MTRKNVGQDKYHAGTQALSVFGSMSSHTQTKTKLLDHLRRSFLGLPAVLGSREMMTTTTTNTTTRKTMLTRDGQKKRQRNRQTDSPKLTAGGPGTPPETAKETKGETNILPGPPGLCIMRMIKHQADSRFRASTSTVCYQQKQIPKFIV